MVLPRGFGIWAIRVWAVPLRVSDRQSETSVRLQGALQVPRVVSEDDPSRVILGPGCGPWRVPVLKCEEWVFRKCGCALVPITSCSHEDAGNADPARPLPLGADCDGGFPFPMGNTKVRKPVAVSLRGQFGERQGVEGISLPPGALPYLLRAVRDLAPLWRVALLASGGAEMGFT